MLVELRDREVIAAWCRRDPVLHAYELGDLDDFFWPFTRWFAWQPGDEPEQVALLYTEPDPPVLLALAGAGHRALTPLLGELAATLPADVYAHLSEPGLDVLGSAFSPVGSPEPHLRFGLASPSALAQVDTTQVEPLEPGQLDEVVALYADAYPGTWFEPRMLETRRYVGVRAGGTLVCVAGVHVYSPAYGIAVLGNVATHPDARGRGLATTACAALCETLLGDGIATIALNVHADNRAAIAAYTRLGFRQAASFVEVMLRRR